MDVNRDQSGGGQGLSELGGVGDLERLRRRSVRVVTDSWGGLLEGAVEERFELNLLRRSEHGQEHAAAGADHRTISQHLGGGR